MNINLLTSMVFLFKSVLIGIILVDCVQNGSSAVLTLKPHEQTQHFKFGHLVPHWLVVVLPIIIDFLIRVGLFASSGSSFFARSHAHALEVRLHDLVMHG